MNPHGFEWSLQGFGMLRMYLSPEIRLHVWSTQHVVPEVSVIHDHPWDFESEIVWGKIRDVGYQQATVYDDAPTHHGAVIKCGPGGGLCGATRDVRLVMVHNKLYTKGMRYSRRADELHESRPEHGTVTIITRRFKADAEHARVYYPLGTSWVSAEPRAATSVEVEQITQAALARLIEDRSPGVATAKEGGEHGC
jgi:hypothetical protein